MDAGHPLRTTPVGRTAGQADSSILISAFPQDFFEIIFSSAEGHQLSTSFLPRHCAPF
jgi:hypothetical protein